MRKIVLACLLIISVACQSQAQGKEFTRVYDKVFVDNDEFRESGWSDTFVVFKFNYKDNPRRVFIKTEGGLELDILQFEETKYGKTTSGYKYSFRRFKGKNGEMYVLQYFEDQKNFGCRLIISDETTLEFNNK